MDDLGFSYANRGFKPDFAGGSTLISMEKGGPSSQFVCSDLCSTSGTVGPYLEVPVVPVFGSSNS